MRATSSSPLPVPREVRDPSRRSQSTRPRWARPIPIRHDAAQSRRVRQAMGRNQEAEALYEQALGIEEAALGRIHPDTILESRQSCRVPGLSRPCRGGRGMLESALAQAKSLSEGAKLWIGRVRLKWARELLVEALGPEAAFVQEAEKLIEEAGTGD